MTKKLLGSLELNRIYQRDCLEGMAMIPDKSVDLIVIDPPYNIGIKGEEWDKWKTVDSYVEFMGSVFRECERVLVPNGSFYWFHNDLPQIAKLMTNIESDTTLIFNSFITWDKGDWRALSWKNPSAKSNLRSWFNSSEYCLYYTFQDEENKCTLIHRDNFKLVIDKIAETASAEDFKKCLLDLNISSNLNSAKVLASYKAGTHRSRFDLLSKDVYEYINSFKKFNYSYDELRKEYEDIRRKYQQQRYTHNLDANHNNVWRFKTENTGKYHACQKPLTVIERIIKTSSNEEGVVLDCFMGSGTTAVAAARLNRNFIGFEREAEYVRVANQRLEAVQDEIAERFVFGRNAY